MSTILIKNGSVVFSDKTELADIFIQDGIIAKIGKNLIEKADKTIDASGKYVMSGFIDMHCHLREPGQTHKEDIESGSYAAVKGGFTTVCCMPNTDPVLDIAPLISFVKTRGQEVNKAKVLPIGAVTKGQKGEELAEMGKMAQAGAVAFSDDGQSVGSGGLMLMALRYASSFDLLMISHCEDKSISLDGVVHEGYHGARAGLKPIPAAAEETAVARDLVLAESVGARLHLAHISTKGSVQLIREAKARGVRVTAETCPHYIALSDKEILSYNTFAKINPPLRTEDDRKAVIEGLKDGTLDAIATDHAPHALDEKNREFDYAPFGTTGLETAFSVCYTILVKSGIMDLSALSRLLSKAPAKILGIAGGELREKAPADITIVDPDRPVTVDAKTHVSKGKNSAFDGMQFYGRIVQTIVDGEEKL